MDSGVERKLCGEGRGRKHARRCTWAGWGHDTAACGVTRLSQPLLSIQMPCTPVWVPLPCSESLCLATCYGACSSCHPPRNLQPSTPRPSAPHDADAPSAIQDVIYTLLVVALGVTAFSERKSLP